MEAKSPTSPDPGPVHIPHRVGSVMPRPRNRVEATSSQASLMPDPELRARILEAGPVQSLPGQQGSEWVQ